ncbi:protein GPR108 [Pelodiscus sinensis]|uniref:protein GPR108 n=1 Tax=Pelodiscus sinensis TaxID=13735 RepID=UPI003F6D01BE
MCGRSRGRPGAGASRGLGRILPLLLLLGGAAGRIHRLVLTGEKRADIHLNTFGFYANGSLEVNVSRLHLSPANAKQEKLWVGFSLSRTRLRETLSYPGKETHNCTLEQAGAESRILFLIDAKNNQVRVQKLGEQKKLQIYPGWISEAQNGGSDPKSADGGKAQVAASAGTTPQQATPGKGPEADGAQKKTEGEVKQQDSSHRVKDQALDLGSVNGSYNFSFHVFISSEAEGLYNLNFHNCHNRAPGNQLPYDITVMIREKNPDGYLSAAEIPLIKLYLVMSACFLAAATVWVYFLCQHKFSVFKIHWLMAALAYTKALSLLFHSINYYFINTEGHPIESLAVMYFVTHLLKGALLFITIALIGTGWAFIKYILSDKEKKLFVVVIPLQVLANVAYIIIESSEEGSSDYASWMQILFLVDLLCCGAILFPVVWSIRHLQEASTTDGKAATNLAKLKLFRHYYVMVVCYIYFSRVLAILLKFTVPFQWQWLYELLVEVSTLVFFILTGYKFRPASNNPYLQLPQEDEEEEEELQMNQVVTEAGIHEGLSKLKKSRVAREVV